MSPAERAAFERAAYEKQEDAIESRRIDRVRAEWRASRQARRLTLVRGRRRGPLY
jgi:hypothetical protein